MSILRIVIAFVAAAVVTYVASSALYTEQVIAAQQAIGANYTAAQQIETYVANIAGQGQLGAMYAIGLLVAFLIAAILKRVLKPLAPIAYPLAGAAAVLTVIWAIETFMASGNNGALAGARGLIGMTLQGLAGAVGGLVFAILLPRR